MGLHCVHASLDGYPEPSMELSGPRPLHRVVNIVSKPRIRSRNAPAVSLENQPNSQVREGVQSNLLQTRVLALPRCLMFRFHQCALCGKPEILRNKSRVVKPYCDGYISRTVTQPLVPCHCQMNTYTLGGHIIYDQIMTPSWLPAVSPRAYDWELSPV